MFEVYEQEDKICICEELLIGGDLIKFYLKKSPRNEETIKTYMKQLFSSINYLHSLGIMHRDIKPENLLMKDK